MTRAGLVGVLLWLALSLAADPSLAASDEPARAAAAAAASNLARHDYRLNCAGCHGLQGQGSDGVPSLTDLERLVRSTASREYVVRVPGVAQAPLSDDRLAALLNWLLAEIARSETSKRFQADEVSALRRRPLSDPAGARMLLD